MPRRAGPIRHPAFLGEELLQGHGGALHRHLSLALVESPRFCGEGASLGQTFVVESPLSSAQCLLQSHIRLHTHVEFSAEHSAEDLVFVW
jgi:hypothetical protein